MFEENPTVVLISPPEIPMGGLASCRSASGFLFDRGRTAQPGIFDRFDQRTRENLALESLAAFLRHRGQRVRILHCDLEKLDLGGAVEGVGRLRPRMVGIALSHVLHAIGAVALARQLRLRYRSLHLCCGGPAVSLAWRQALTEIPEFDSVVVGEGEETLANLAEALERGETWRQIPGLATRQGSEMVLRPRRDHLDMAQLPFAARDGLRILATHGATPQTVMMAASRSCLAGCQHCQGEAPTPSLRFRAVDHLVEEMAALLTVEQVRRFVFVDGDFFARPREDCQRIDRFATTLAAHQLTAELSVAAHPRSIADGELKRLRDVGLRQLVLDLDPLLDTEDSERQHALTTLETARRLELEVLPALGLFRRHTDPRQLREALHRVRAAGLQHSPQPFLLLNRLQLHPGDQLQDILRCEFGHGLEDYPRCQDERIDLLWRTVRFQVGQLYDRSRHQLPVLAAGLWQGLRRGTVSPQNRRLFSRLKAWPRGLGELLLELLTAGLDEVENNGGNTSRAAASALAEGLRKRIEAYDERHLGEPFEGLVGRGWL